MLGLERSGGKGGRRGNTQQEQDRAGWRKPAMMRRLLQTDLQAGKRDGDQRKRISVERSQIGETRLVIRQQEGCGGCRNDAGGDVDQKQPMPGPGFGNPATDHRSDRGCEHGHNAGHRRGNRVQTDRKQQEDSGKYRRNQRAAGKALKHAEADKRRKAAAERAADRGEGKKADRNNEQPSQRQNARKPAGQWNGDDLGDQIRGLNPAHRIPRYGECILDRG